MVVRHRLGPVNQLDCPHAMRTNAFSQERAESFRYALLLPPTSLANQRPQADEDSSRRVAHSSPVLA